jgi:hypothetical protein
MPYGLANSLPPPQGKGRRSFALRQIRRPEISVSSARPAGPVPAAQNVSKPVIERTTLRCRYGEVLVNLIKDDTLHRPSWGPLWRL